MTNADKFKEIFGLYATELWAKPEKEFLEWLNKEVPDTNDGDFISRKAAIYALGYRPTVLTRKDEYALGQRDRYDADRFAIEHLMGIVLSGYCPKCGRRL